MLRAAAAARDDADALATLGEQAGDGGADGAGTDDDMHDVLPARFCEHCSLLRTTITQTVPQMQEQCSRYGTLAT
ncbi:hypothetical protein GCM10025331_00610 [Actinoplanes utahensis]|nr:hypothetical protein Aut01nite_07890 [Actinoplanes utahensis]